MISSGNLALLEEKGLLDSSKHPTIKAFEIASNTTSADICPLCQELWEHANHCPTCSQRAEMALQKKHQQ